MTVMKMMIISGSLRKDLTCIGEHCEHAHGIVWMMCGLRPIELNGSLHGVLTHCIGGMIASRSLGAHQSMLIKTKILEYGMIK